jgi:hypothetical protein
VDPVNLSREDFLDEIRIAPKWDIVKYYKAGYYDLIVFYGFTLGFYRSPSIFEMEETERKYFYQELHVIVNTPWIKEAKVG